jgi:hypothetical protein
MKTGFVAGLMAITAVMFAAVAHGEETSGDTGGKKPFSFTFEPTMMDSGNSDTSTLGLAYRFSGDATFVKGKNDGVVKVGDEYEQRWDTGTLSYSGSGVVAADAERNPENLLDFQLDLTGEHGRLRSGRPQVTAVIYSYSAFVKYETDQSFKNRQAVYGGQFATTIRRVLTDDRLFLKVAYGQVKPGQDTERATALGVAADKLKSYYRADTLMDYTIYTKGETVRTIDLIYRSYSEISAPATVRAAHLDRFSLATVRVGFGNKFFVAYSSGKLPFNKRNDDTLKLGISFKLK